VIGGQEGFAAVVKVLVHVLVVATDGAAVLAQLVVV
jgi:hypothetical protein